MGDLNPIAVGSKLNNRSAGQCHAGFAVEHQSREYHDGGIDKKSDRQRCHRINGIEFDRIPDRGFILLKLPGLDESRMQVEVVGHDGRADDPDGQDEHAGLVQVRVRQGATHFQKARLGLREDKNFNPVTDRNRRNEHADDGFDFPHSQAFQREQQEDVEGRNHHRPEERNVKQQV